MEDGTQPTLPGLAEIKPPPWSAARCTSPVVATAFGPTTAGTYADAGPADWPLAGLFVAGGVLGSALDGRAAHGLARRRGAPTKVIAGLIILVAASCPPAA